MNGLPFHGIYLDAVGTGRTCIFQLVLIENEGIDRLVGFRKAHFHVEVRTEGITGVACPSHDLSLLYGKAVGGKGGIEGKGLVLVLMFAHKGCHFGKEALQVSMYGGIAVVVGDIEGIPISSGGDTDAGDMTIGGTKKGFAFHALCLEVYSSVEMVAPKFGKISA